MKHLHTRVWACAWKRFACERNPSHTWVPSRNYETVSGFCGLLYESSGWTSKIAQLCVLFLWDIHKFPPRARESPDKAMDLVRITHGSISPSALRRCEAGSANTMHSLLLVASFSCHRKDGYSVRGPFPLKSLPAQDAVRLSSKLRNPVYVTLRLDKLCSGLLGKVRPEKLCCNVDAGP